MGEIPVQNLSGVASTDLSGNQYCFVKLDSNGQLALDAAGGEGIGILQDKPKAGQTGRVMVLGESFCVYGAAITAGQRLTSDTNGNAVPVSQATDAVLAIARESGAADEIHTVLLKW